MGPTVHGRFSRHLDSLRQQFLQRAGSRSPTACNAETVSRSDGADQGLLERPDLHQLVTPVVILSQSDPQRPIVPAPAAVARLIMITINLSQGLPPYGLGERGAYCQARKRLPLEFFAAVTRRVEPAARYPRGSPMALEKAAKSHLFDGSITVAMPDTPENRKDYPLTATRS